VMVIRMSSKRGIRSWGSKGKRRMQGKAVFSRSSCVGRRVGVAVGGRKKRRARGGKERSGNEARRRSLKKKWTEGTQATHATVSYASLKSDKRFSFYIAVVMCVQVVLRVLTAIRMEKRKAKLPEGWNHYSYAPKLSLIAAEVPKRVRHCCVCASVIK